MPEHPTAPRRDELDPVLDRVAAAAREYVRSVDERHVLDPEAARVMDPFHTPLPEEGMGAVGALDELLEEGMPAATTTSGPRFFHWVTGGVTPAALGADWLTGLLDQQAYAWLGSPLGAELELVALDWLEEMFGIPDSWTGVMVTGASMANFVGLASARQWWGERHGVDVAEEGLAGLPPMPVLSGGYIHASAVKVLAMLGVGRGSIHRHVRDDAGRVDLDALEAHLRALDGEPAVIAATAGEVNAGDFDPIDDLADLAEEYGAWLHVDGAFGLFAALSPRTRHLVRGLDRAHSVTVDGHKWLNVPYDSGYAFVHDRRYMAKAFAYTADYLWDEDDPRPGFGHLGPESSRRARSLAVWATLRAYGREGYRALVERHLDLAREMADLVDEAPKLERLAEVPLNVVCFRYDPGDLPEEELDRLNTRLGERILEDGRVFAGTTTYRGKVAMRPTLVNWRTRSEDVAFFVEVVRELAAAVGREVGPDGDRARPTNRASGP